MSDWEEIPLCARDGSVKAVVKVSAEDAEHLNQHRWKLSTKGYAVRNRYDYGEGKWFTLCMHREIMGLSKGDPLQVDHISRDKLDNRRENLRIVTDAEQRQNVPARGGYSRYRGVCRTREGRWWGKVGRAYLGVFEDEEECARAVLAARRRLYPMAVD